MAGMKKKPLKVYLRQEQLEPLRALAERRGESLAALVRQGVDLLLAEVSIQEDPLWDIVGLGRSDVGDLALRHDDYLAEDEIEPAQNEGQQ
jgi:hypothetical protein